MPLIGKKSLVILLSFFMLAILALAVAGTIAVVPQTASEEYYPVAAQANPEPNVGTTTASWTQIQHDAQHTGRTTISVPPGPLIPFYKVAWAWAAPDKVVTNFNSVPNTEITDSFGAGFRFNVVFAKQMQPIIAGGRTFFGSINGYMYAVDALTGTNLWSFSTGSSLVASAAYVNGILVFGSLDGKIYGVDATNGNFRWSYLTGGGVQAAPIVGSDGTVYVGSRDGSFYALNGTTGALAWKYATHFPPNGNSPFNSAPIVAPAALSEDGSKVFFGAENMYFYGLNTGNGTESWNPVKMNGQSFLFGWPVVQGNRVVVRTMSQLPGAEGSYTGIEEILDRLGGCPNPCTYNNDPANWPAPNLATERTEILNWLSQRPHQKTMYVLDTDTGTEPFQVAMGRVSGNNFTPHPPVVDNSNRLLSYWRITSPTFFSTKAGECYGTKHCPDVSAMDLSNGNRIPIANPYNPRFAPELDNAFQFTVGGDYLYMFNSFRGVIAINLTSGKFQRVTASMAKWDCGNFRSAGFSVVYYGNDNAPECTYDDPRPVRNSRNPEGFSGVALAETNGVRLMYINETDSGLIVAIKPS